MVLPTGVITEHLLCQESTRDQLLSCIPNIFGNVEAGQRSDGDRRGILKTAADSPCERPWRWHRRLMDAPPSSLRCEVEIRLIAPIQAQMKEIIIPTPNQTRLLISARRTTASRTLHEGNKSMTSESHLACWLTGGPRATRTSIQAAELRCKPALCSSRRFVPVATSSTRWVWAGGLRPWGKCKLWQQQIRGEWDQDQSDAASLSCAKNYIL